MNKKVAIIIPWYGKELKGGVEQLAYQIAKRLNVHNPVEVLTTCSKSFLDDWFENYYSPGEYMEEGVSIRRFEVDTTQPKNFGMVNEQLLNLELEGMLPGLLPIPKEYEDIYVQENINSGALLNYLKEHKNKYHAFIFLPYLYGMIIKALPLVSDKAYLQPCLHNESYAYLTQIANIFHQAKGLLFNSEGEKFLAETLYGPGIITKSTIVGSGIETNVLTQNDSSMVTGDKYILYLGRRDETKGINVLINAFKKYKEANPENNIKLLMAGPGIEEYSDKQNGIYDLGLVSEKEKSALLNNCIALFQPSDNESFSRVMYEAWYCGKPVVVNKKCMATALALNSSGGGWIADSEENWIEKIEIIDKTKKDELITIGLKGKQYAEELVSWDSVISKYIKVLNLKNSSSISKKNDAIHQLTAGFVDGDAISYNAYLLREYIQTLGYDSNIYALHVAPDVRKKFDIKYPEELNYGSLIYHHSIGDDIVQYAKNHKLNKCLIYHNITPAEFFYEYDPFIASLLEKGREDLKSFKKHFTMVYGDSQYNCDELVSQGFKNVSVLGLPVIPNKWDINYDVDLYKNINDGTTKIIFVGRISPNKKQDDLIKVFNVYRNINENSKLYLVGGGDQASEYYKYISRLIADYNLKDKVIITGHVTDNQLLTYYKLADLFWSMSEHEGFGVPLIEAMWFDIPVFAYNSSAVPETLGKGGLLFSEKNDFTSLAILANFLIFDQELKSKVLKYQKKNRQKFLWEKYEVKVSKLINSLVTK